MLSERCDIPPDVPHFEMDQTCSLHPILVATYVISVHGTINMCPSKHVPIHLLSCQRLHLVE